MSLYPDTRNPMPEAWRSHINGPLVPMHAIKWRLFWRSMKAAAWLYLFLFIATVLFVALFGE